MATEKFDLRSSQFDLLIEYLKEIKRCVSNNRVKGKIDYIDNNDLIEILHVSKNTAKYWRVNGLIAYSQIGHKFYYSLDEVNAFIKRHHARSQK